MHPANKVLIRFVYTVIGSAGFLGFIWLPAYIIVLVVRLGEPVTTVSALFVVAVTLLSAWTSWACLGLLREGEKYAR